MRTRTVPRQILASLRTTDGQVLTEYLLTTAVMASVGLLFTLIVGPALRQFVRAVALALRTMAP